MIAPSFRPDGSSLDLANVQPSDIDFAEMAAALSKIARFDGRYACAAYSVAQHSVLGADALYYETGGDDVAAGYFVLHDGHEFLLGDMTRPVVDYLDHLDGGEGRINAAVALAKARIDVAIWRRANRAPPGSYPDKARLVAEMDERMLRAEALALFGPEAARQFSPRRMKPPRLVGAIKPWPADVAMNKFIERLDRYLGIRVRAL